jgi:hypothetical protein
MSSLYQRVFFPRLLESSIGGEAAGKERAQALKSVHGEVLEIGFGTGLNLPYYPGGVTRLVALDPEDMLPEKVSQRIAAVNFPVQRVRQTGEQLPFNANRFDCVVTTWALCTIPDAASARVKCAGSFVQAGATSSTSTGAARIRGWPGFRTGLTRYGGSPASAAAATSTGRSTR